MITGEQKPIKEILKIIEPYKKLLILGCGTCVKTCFAGGEDEVAVLASALRLVFKNTGKKIQIKEFTIERQCENEFIQESTMQYFPLHVVPGSRQWQKDLQKYLFYLESTQLLLVYRKARVSLLKNVQGAVTANLQNLVEYVP